MLVIIESALSIISKSEFLSPEYFKISISLLLNSFIKNSCIVNKNINGNIWKIVSGEFKNMLKDFKAYKNKTAIEKNILDTLKIKAKINYKNVWQLFFLMFIRICVLM